MTRGQILTEAIDLHFPTADVRPAQIRNWIAAREAEVWQYADWPIKDTVVLNLTVTQGTATIALPTGFTFPWQELEIYDDNGNSLAYMPQGAFYDRYQSYAVPTQVKGPGEAWTFTTDVSGAPSATLQIRIAPTPETNRTYTVRGWSLPISRSAAATYKIGTMSTDTDLPWWPDDFHYFLVDGVAATGKRHRGDGSFEADEAAFRNGLEGLARTIIPSDRLGTRQFGRWCAWQ